MQHDFSARWTASTSVVHYSGFEGAKAYAAYASTFTNPPSAIPISDPGYDTPYGPNFFWNAGLELRAATDWSLRLDGYNLVALADETLSKRNYYFRLSEFNVQPASLSLSVRYRF